MDAQPETPPAAGGDLARTADAYELFWACVENDAPVRAEVTPAASDPADAYGLFWELAEF